MILHQIGAAPGGWRPMRVVSQSYDWRMRLGAGNR